VTAAVPAAGAIGHDAFAVVLTVLTILIALIGIFWPGRG
jgi:hypothetical protein